MIKKITATVLISLIAAVGYSIFTPQAKVSAGTWCGVLAQPISISSPPQQRDCQRGQYYNAMEGLSAGSDGYRSSLINRINQYANSGNYNQRTGAWYIIGQLGGYGNFARGIKMTSISYESYFSCVNTAYDSNNDRIVTYGLCGNFYSVVLRYNGAVVYAIKVDCGNPLGNLTWMPPPDNAKPKGSISIQCNSDGSAVVNFKWSDADGANNTSNAYTAIATNATNTTPKYAPSFFAGNAAWTYHSAGTRYSQNVPAAQTLGGSAVYANLYVQDVGPSGSTNFYNVNGAKQVKCDHPPVGTVTGDCPVGIKAVNAYDPDSPSTNVRIDIYSTAAAGQPGAIREYTGRASGRTLIVPLSSIPGVANGTLGIDQQPVKMWVYIINVNDTGAEAFTAAHKITPLTIGPCNSCQSIPVTSASNDNSPQPGEPFTINFKVYYPDVASMVSAVRYPVTLSVSGPSGNQAVRGTNLATGTSGSGAATRYFLTGTATFAGMSPTGQNAIVLTAGGSYPVEIAPAGSPTPCRMNVSAKPYVSVGVGDIIAGAPIIASNGNCTTQNTAAGIAGWNSNQPGYSGAGGKFGATALATITGFATAQGSDQSGSGLAFANTGSSPVNGNFGGSFGDAGACWQPPTVNVSTAAGGTLAGKTVAIGQHQTIHYTGDLYISGNVIYAEGWGNLRDIPSLIIYVDGNIFIGANVTRLDGTFVARPTAAANSGKIYTCATGASAIDTTSPGYFATCGKQLVVNGSLIAKTVYLLRTCGTLQQAVANEPVTTAGGSDLLTCGSGSHAAEVINNGPSDWLGRGNMNGLTGDQWDSVVSLPPVL